MVRKVSCVYEVELETKVRWLWRPKEYGGTHFVVWNDFTFPFGTPTHEGLRMGKEDKGSRCRAQPGACKDNK